MKKFVKYIIKNVQQIIYILLISVFFVFLINPATDTLIAITALVLFLLILFRRRLQKLLQRCINTYNLEDPPFLYPLNIFLFILISTLLIILFQNKHISIPNISLKFIAFSSINSILIIIWFFSSFHWKPKKVKNPISNKEKLSLSDEAIKFPEQDLFDRGKFIEDLQKGIENIPFSDSFVFGLYGSWGEGKTSVINLLINKLKDSRDYLIVNFDPWNFKDEEAILAAFYNKIEQSLSQNFILSGFKKTFMKYQSLVSMGLSQTGIKINFSDTKESIE
ncbi:unnamed protein product, partial [marine sediment metagenome]